MIRLKCDVQKLSIDIIDDSESTPGASRQITEFKHFVLAGLRRKVSSLDLKDPFLGQKLADVLSILDNNSFKLTKSVVKDGTIINDYEYKGE